MKFEFLGFEKCIEFKATNYIIVYNSSFILKQNATKAIHNIIMQHLHARRFRIFIFELASCSPASYQVFKTEIVNGHVEILGLGLFNLQYNSYGQRDGILISLCKKNRIIHSKPYYSNAPIRPTNSLLPAMAIHAIYTEANLIKMAT